MSDKLFMTKVFLYLLPVSLLLIGCSMDSDLYTTHEVDSQAEAGSTQVTVLSVLRWRDYKDSLGPGFKYTGTQALNDVVPNTLSAQEGLLEGFAAKLKIAPPQISSTSTSTSYGATGMPNTTTVSGTTTKTAGNLANVPADTDSIQSDQLPQGAFDGTPC
jgi:hypothetical protein